jgi:hypothetical protein
MKKEKREDHYRFIKIVHFGYKAEPNIIAKVMGIPIREVRKIINEIKKTNSADK